MTDPPLPRVIVLSRQKPHLFLFQFLAILTGLQILAGPDERGAMEREVPGMIQVGWAWGLTISGALTLAAHMARRFDPDRYMGIECGALLIQAGMVLLYGTVLFVVAGWAATLSGGLALAWAAANIWEVRLIRRDLQLIVKARR